MLLARWGPDRRGALCVCVCCWSGQVVLIFQDGGAGVVEWVYMFLEGAMDDAWVWSMGVDGVDGCLGRTDGLAGACMAALVIRPSLRARAFWRGRSTIKALETSRQTTRASDRLWHAGGSEDACFDKSLRAIIGAGA